MQQNSSKLSLLRTRKFNNNILSSIMKLFGDQAQCARLLVAVSDDAGCLASSEEDDESAPVECAVGTAAEAMGIPHGDMGCGIIQGMAPVGIPGIPGASPVAVGMGMYAMGC